ncbi:stage II sporulation protein P [Sedimentibacter sp. B4]|uniref:stage II sporulation protein P n=1 Tax=Sedimentibacter sp. B4 TaxID=304766 RepID=UPI0003179651|nr:stage II sporulation protein P [Sedimentibacter sp. B4]
MKRRRRNKGGTKFYMVMSVLCLAILFVGYSYVYNMSEKRKEGQEVTTISINYNGDDKNDEQLSALDKMMSYFNIFLEKTFNENTEGSDDSEEKQETDETSSQDGKIVETNDDKEKEVFKTIDSKTENEKPLEIYDESKENIDNVEKTVYLANNRKEDFFKIVESKTSRSSGPRDLFLDAASINENLNLIIYHTHGTESFYPDEGSNYRSLDEGKNVTGIGNIIAANLEGNGINLTHLQEYNDYPDYNSSYANSNYAVSQILSNSKKNLLIDIHRDGAEENSEYEAVLSQVKTTYINDRAAATCTLVVGDKNGNYEQVKQTADKLYAIAEEMYPGLFRKIIVRPGAYFNQYLSNQSMLIEIGSSLNTLDEAQYSADLVSQVLLEYIDEISK